MKKAYQTSKAKQANYRYDDLAVVESAIPCDQGGIWMNEVSPWE